MKVWPLVFTALPLFLASCAGLKRADKPPSVVSAAAPAFVYEGRINKGNPLAPVLIWQASRVTLEFEGEGLSLLFGKTFGQNYFDAEVDGVKHLVKAEAGMGTRWDYPGKLGKGRHKSVLFKRSEASAGTAVFLGAELAAGKALLPARPKYGPAMLFFGDSITAGACTEDGATDQWEDRSTHNNAKSYAALTAAAFNADYRNIAVSGMGISEGYVEVKAGQVWDKLYPKASSPRAALSWTPDIIFVNYGENDYSFTRGQKLPFPPDFAAKYAALVKDIRGAWPKARIVLLRGGMNGGANGTELIAAWTSAADKLEAEDKLVSRFVFKHWTDNHPRAADAEKMAGELTAWLRAQDFAKAWPARN